MFGDLMGNAQQKQEEMKLKLAAMTVEASAGDGAIKVTASADRRILDISIDKAKLDWEDTDQLQDLLVTALNRALELAAEKEAEESQKLLSEMLPPGFGGLSNFFE